MVTQESFGRLLWRYRRDAGPTQDALATRAGLSVRALRVIELGSHHKPRRDTLELLRAVLAVPAEEHAALLEAAAQVAPQELVPAPVSASVHTVLVADIRHYTSFSTEQADDAAAHLPCRSAEIAGAVVTTHLQVLV
jgi:transcriptional regulator with XRE-family HTH domain